MKIIDVIPQANWTLNIITDDGRSGDFDVSHYLEDEAFAELKDPDEFAKVFNGGYFIEWACGADLSADTIEMRWQERIKQFRGKLHWEGNLDSMRTNLQGN